MKQYKYVGDTEIELQGVGVVKPEQVVEAMDINHPLFKEVEVKTPKDIKK